MSTLKYFGELIILAHILDEFLWVWGCHGLHKEFQNSQGYMKDLVSKNIFCSNTICDILN